MTLTQNILAENLKTYTFTILSILEGDFFLRKRNAIGLAKDLKLALLKK